MNPVNFPGANTELLPPPGQTDCKPLPCHRGDNLVTSQWELSAKELAQLIVSRRIVLRVQGGTQPPLWLEVLGA